MSLPPNELFSQISDVFSEINEIQREMYDVHPDCCEKLESLTAKYESAPLDPLEDAKNGIVRSREQLRLQLQNLSPQERRRMLVAHGHEYAWAEDQIKTLIEAVDALGMSKRAVRDTLVRMWVFVDRLRKYSNSVERRLEKASHGERTKNFSEKLGELRVAAMNGENEKQRELLVALLTDLEGDAAAMTEHKSEMESYHCFLVRQHNRFKLRLVDLKTQVDRYCADIEMWRRPALELEIKMAEMCYRTALRRTISI